jgi:hypothetical protein
MVILVYEEKKGYQAYQAKQDDKVCNYLIYDCYEFIFSRFRVTWLTGK